MKKLLVVDGNSILNRAYYGIRPLTTKEGLFTNAVYGMVHILQKQIEAVNPDVCAIAFDRHEPTFRHTMYAEYKAGRHATPDELKMQFPYAKDVARAMGFTVLEKAGYEADDILGTLSAQANAAGDEAYVLTGDRDSLQLIGGGTTILLATNKETVTFDRTRFFTDYGIQPEEFVDVKALMGDPSDHIPGVAGIGEKTALKLIADYHTLDALYENLDEKDIAKGVKTKLNAGRESAYFSQKLATIIRDAPLDEAYESLPAFEQAQDRTALRDLFVKLEFSALIKQLGMDAEPSPDENTTEEQNDTPTVEAREISASQLTALDKSAPVSLYTADGALYIGTAEGVLVCRESPDTWTEFLCGSERTFRLHDSKSFYHKMAESGILCAKAAFDTMLAGYLLNPAEGAYPLERLCLTYQKKILDANADGATLADAIYRLTPILSEKLREDGMERLFYDVELPLAFVLFRMECRGFKVDVAGLNDYGRKLGDLCADYENRICMAAGMTFNVNSPKQLGEVLFDTLKLPCPSSKRSTNAETLKKLRPYHPIIDDILEYRQVAKLKSTYTDGLVKVADENGRIHSSFNQTVTATGRLSSTEPNLQNIPIRTEAGRILRKYFVPSDENHILIDADYSQIELRLLAAISGDETMTDAFVRGVDIHTVTASQVFGIPEERVTPELRKRAKAVNFGIVYGIGGYSLAMDIGVSTRQAGMYIDSYMEKYPKVSAYLKNIVKQAKENGYVTTMYGRRRYIPELTATKKTLISFGERVAMNSPIQGTAADVIKAAMVNLERELEKSGLDAQLILQVHDELIVECAKDCEKEVCAIVRREMEHVVSLPVPLTVDVQAGETWFDGH